MDSSAVLEYLRGKFDGLVIAESDGNAFVTYNPERKLPEQKWHPFATVVTNDLYDTVSDLNRPGVYRLNIGVSRESFDRLFGAVDFPAEPFSPARGFDYTALNTIMPHPVYGRQHWACVLSPDDHTWENIRPLLTEAYERATARYSAAVDGRPES